MLNSLVHAQRTAGFFGGRRVDQRFNGTFMDAPFKKIGYNDYDNVQKVYVGSWVA